MSKSFMRRNRHLFIFSVMEVTKRWIWVHEMVKRIKIINTSVHACLRPRYTLFGLLYLPTSGSLCSPDYTPPCAHARAFYFSIFWSDSSVYSHIYNWGWVRSSRSLKTLKHVHRFSKPATQGSHLNFVRNDEATRRKRNWIWPSLLNHIPVYFCTPCKILYQRIPFMLHFDV